MVAAENVQRQETIITVTVHRKFLQKVQNVKIGNLRFCLRCGKNSVCKTKMTLSGN
jgi:hypothetical protein